MRTRDSFALAMLWVPYALLVNHFWFICDDAYITFRFSRNWARGFGPRYNLGEHIPVEGYSNFLWMLLATPIEWLDADPAFWMPLLSVACGLMLISMVFHTLRQQFEMALPVAYLATLSMACFPPFAVWSSSGLATMPQALLMFAGLAVVMRADTARSVVLGGCLALLLALVRTEGIYWAILIGLLGLGVRYAQRRPWRNAALGWFGVLLTGYAIYYGWRYNYYHSAVSNTAYAKVHISSASLQRGLKYVTLYGTTMVTPLLMGLGVIAVFFHRQRWEGFPYVLLAFAVPAFCVVVSGDYMTFFRMLVPGVAFMAVCFAFLYETAWSKWPRLRPAVIATGLVIVVVGCLPAASVHLVPSSVRGPLNVREKLPRPRSEVQQWQIMVQHTEHWTERGLALAEYADPTDTYVAAAIGATGYFSNLFIYDRNGLVNRSVAMQPDTGPLRSPGHDKVVERSFFLDDKPIILEAKVLSPPRARARVKQALREMKPHEVDPHYAPTLHTLETVGTPKKPRYLLVLGRVQNGQSLERRWQEYEDALGAL